VIDGVNNAYGFVVYRCLSQLNLAIVLEGGNKEKKARVTGAHNPLPIFADANALAGFFEFKVLE
jgi:hypothetical protein